jgi:uncharacterized membrane protein
MFSHLFTAFVAGSLAILPLLITLVVVGFVYTKLTQWLGPNSRIGQLLHKLSKHWDLPPAVIYGLSMVAVVVLITALGLFATRATEAGLDRVLDSIPLVSTLYQSSKQVVNVLGGEKQTSVPGGGKARVVLARIANGSVLGLLASDKPVVVAGQSYYMIYWPSTPLPASGQNYLVPVQDVKFLDMTVDELTQTYLSMGSMAPQLVNGKEVQTAPDAASAPAATAAPGITPAAPITTPPSPAGGGQSSAVTPGARAAGGG